MYRHASSPGGAFAVVSVEAFRVSHQLLDRQGDWARDSNCCTPAASGSMEVFRLGLRVWNDAGVRPLHLLFLQGRAVMDWNRVEGNWKQVKGKVKEQWGKLTDDDLDVIDGKQEQLEGRLQQRYGYAKDQAQSEVNTWFDRQKW